MTGTGRGPYRGPAWIPGGHLQTIVPHWLRRPRIDYRRERLATPDGDFVDLDWLADAPPAAPLVMLFHGLEGDSRSHYALALMAHLQSVRWRGVVAHWRGCSGEPNRLPRAYHSGDHVDARWLAQSIAARANGAPVYAAGVSLGGSALLNWLGRDGASAGVAVRAAAAVSAPLDLMAAGTAIDQGTNRIYSRHFLTTLVPKALAMAARFPDRLDPVRIRTVRSMRAFDDTVTAPLHGFADVVDYWTRASSKPWLAGVGVPTLVLNARNDPFIPAGSLPTRAEVSADVVLEQPDEGGHAGFPDTPFGSPANWLAGRLVAFFASHPGRANSA